MAIPPWTCPILSDRYQCFLLENMRESHTLGEERYLLCVCASNEWVSVEKKKSSSWKRHSWLSPIPCGEEFRAFLGCLCFLTCLLGCATGANGGHPVRAETQGQEWSLLAHGRGSMEVSPSFLLLMCVLCLWNDLDVAHYYASRCAPNALSVEHSRKLLCGESPSSASVGLLQIMCIVVA